MAVLTAIIAGILSYLIGSVNFSIILSKIISGEDIRNSGSGNAGATNMLRTLGKAPAAATLILDVLKGVLCVVLAKVFVSRAGGAELDKMCLPYIAGLCAVLGHNFPIYFGFKGGKGVATSLGVVMTLDWKVGLIVMIVSLAIMAATRYVSFGSVLGSVLFVIIKIIKDFVTGDIQPVGMICIIIMGALIVIRHRANIKRLLNGTENKLGSKH